MSAGVSGIGISEQFGQTALRLLSLVGVKNGNGSAVDCLAYPDHACHDDAGGVSFANSVRVVTVCKPARHAGNRVIRPSIVTIRTREQS